jgi:hypothetical protein
MRLHVSYARGSTAFAERRTEIMEDELKPKYGSIAAVAHYTGESQWAVKDKLRRKKYRAKKSGRRTLIDLSSVDEHLAALPEAKFATPRATKKVGGPRG